MKNACTAFVYETPDAVIGDVPDFGFAKIFRNVAKCASGMISFDVSDDLVVGTFRRPFDSSASAWSFVVRYLTSAQAWSRLWPFFGMPMIVPLM